MIKGLLTLVLLLLVTVLSAQDDRVRFVKSDEPVVKIKKGQEYTFGYLEVPENSTDPNSAIVRLPVYIFKSRNKQPKKDPIIYTVGGPGSSTMFSAPYMNYYQYLDDRDFILFEQRGTYFAEPHLSCPEWSEVIYRSNLPGFRSELKDSLLLEAASSCRKRLVEKGIDLNRYNTEVIAEDINHLVNALGIESYNFLSMSYSTKIAQVLMRDYPSKIRSIVMDSPLPLEVNYGEESLSNIMSSVESLLSDCAQNEACNNAFPQLKMRLYEFLSELVQNPLELEFKNPNTDERETFLLDADDVLLFITSVSGQEVDKVPFEINKLIEGDHSAIISGIEALFEGPSSGAGIGMRLSVWCSEEQPFNDPKRILNERKVHTFLSHTNSEVFSKEVCGVWSVERAKPRENLPVKSSIPVLLLSGSYDNETPPRWASSMLPNLTNGYHLVFEAWKHTITTNWSNQCAMELANKFFNDPSKKPVTPCFLEIGKPEFKVE